MDNYYWLFLSAFGLASFLLIIGLYAAWNEYWHPRLKVLDNRMHQLFRQEKRFAPNLIIQARSLSRYNWLDHYLKKLPGVGRFDRFLRQTDLPLDVSQVLMAAMILIILCGLLGYVLGLQTGLTILLMLASLSFAFFYLKRHRTRRIIAIEKHLPDALDLMVRAQQSGHAFTSALQITASESRPPISVELRMVFDEINLGMSMQAAMSNLAARIDSKEIRYFVVAVLIQSETGGNLSDVLRKTAILIRERQKIAGVVRVLSAEGRISAWILSVMPFLLAFFLYLINPEFISALWKEELGLTMLGLSLGLMLFGIYWMSTLVRIKV